MKHFAHLFLTFILLTVITLTATTKPATAQGMATVSLAATQVGVAETAQIDATITCDAGNCIAFSAELHFDPQYIRVDSAEIGPYLGTQVYNGDHTIDNVQGIIKLGAASLSGAPAAGETVLFRIQVTGLVPGAIQMTLQSLQVQDPTGNQIPLTQRGSDIVIVETGKIPPFSPPAYDWMVAFVTDRDGNPEIYSMNADGSGLLRLTDNPARDSAPDWSPAGDKIAFVSDRDANPEIYVMNADGTNPVRLTNTPSSESEPAWSPDGRQIAYVSDQDGNPEIYVMNADGSNPVRLTDNPAVDDEPTWKPDGSVISFISTRDGATSEVYMMGKDGSNVQRITNSFGSNGWYPTFSPDGSQIAFTVERDGSADIYAMAADGTNPTKLTPDSGPLTLSAWSPNAGAVAFASNRDGDADLYVINIGLNRLFRLNDDASIEQEPDWKGGAAPCTVSTTRGDVGVRVGPGANRSIYTFLKPNSVVSVIGQYADEGGATWWQLDKTQVDAGYTGESLWVSEAEMDEQGSCSLVAAGTPSEYHEATTQQNTGNGQWQPCGSCNTCGHQQSECVTSPDGQCLWDPSTCAYAPPSQQGTVSIPGKTCYSVSLSANPASGGTVSASGASCGGNSFEAGTTVTISATPAAGMGHSGWSGTCPNMPTSGGSFSFTITSNCSAQARFFMIYKPPELK